VWKEKLRKKGKGNLQRSDETYQIDVLQVYF
jgi:hypothetical protein